MERLSKSELQREHEEVRQIILELAHSDKKEVTLSSGEKSRHYFDLRPLMLDGKLGPRLAEHACDLLERADVAFTTVGGMALGAVPFAKDIANANDLPAFIIRKEEKDYGTRQQIENIPSADDEILIVDDVVTTGSSLMRSVEILQDHGLEPVIVLAFIDRSEGAVKRLLQDQGITYMSVFTAEELLDQSSL